MKKGKFQEEEYMSTRQQQLEKVLEGLKQAEKEYIKGTYLDRLTSWAKLLNKAESLYSVVEKVANNIPLDQLQRAIDDFNGILRDIERLDFDNSTDSIQHVKNRIQDFQTSGRLIDIVNFINIARAASDDTGQPAQLKKLIDEAKQVSEQYEKSFQVNFRRQQKRATRTLASHYETRIKELQDNDSTSPARLLSSRNHWMIILGAIVVLMMAFSLLDFNWTKAHIAQLIIAKVTIVFLISSQVYFKQRNFNIYSDLVARYKHMSIVASTITDSLVSDVDPILKEKLINNGVETMFTKIDTGHLKQSDFHNREQINNVISGLTTR